MPAALIFSRKLMLRHSHLLHSGEIDYLRPDGKSQVTVEYDGDTPVRLDAVVVSRGSRLAGRGSSALAGA